MVSAAGDMSSQLPSACCLTTELVYSCACATIVAVVPLTVTDVKAT